MDSAFTNSDAALVRRSLELAAGGIGLASPNPLVGCVVTDRDGNVVGEGTFEYERVTHAEAIALEQAGERARGGTAYVSLEPHSYHGRTPPCTEALIAAGIARVVCPIEDPNPRVSGRGFDALRAAGIEVVTGLLADEARRLNEKFCVWHDQGRPFVHLKLAMSLDGRISLANSVSTALSGTQSAARVQEIRHEHDAILVGGTTAFVDDPSLTDRSGKRRRRPLVRIVLDNRLRIPIGSTLVRTAHETPTLVVTNSLDGSKLKELRKFGVDVENADARDLDQVMRALRTRELQSVLVEGGSAVAGAFADAKLVDKVTLIVAPLLIGGSSAPNAIGGSGARSLAEAMRLKRVNVMRHGPDIEITGYPDDI